ncbi:unnamed protein product [Durusdinium trenchii]|uniref:Uncharacterized protein n=1 Tax=Durusdinium trenchii TaxID=1381693 RepID=A0ABP0RNC1_9DINO
MELLGEQKLAVYRLRFTFTLDSRADAMRHRSEPALAWAFAAAGLAHFKALPGFCPTSSWLCRQGTSSWWRVTPTSSSHFFLEMSHCPRRTMQTLLQNQLNRGWLGKTSPLPCGLGLCPKWLRSRMSRSQLWRWLSSLLQSSGSSLERLTLWRTSFGHTSALHLPEVLKI